MDNYKGTYSQSGLNFFFPRVRDSLDVAPGPFQAWHTWGRRLAATASRLVMWRLAAWARGRGAGRDVGDLCTHRTQVGSDVGQRRAFSRAELSPASCVRPVNRSCLSDVCGTSR